MLMDDVRLLATNEKELETLIQTIRIYSPDRDGEFRIEKRAMLIIKSEKKINTGRNIIAKQGKNQNVWREGKLQVLGSIGSGYHQTNEN